MAVKSFTIYEEYYDLISLLDKEEQKDFIYAIFEYMFHDIEPNLNDKENKIFKNLKRPLDISKKRSKNGSKKITNENQKEIKLKSNQNQNEIKQKTHQDVNVNVNVNNIYSYYENIYTRTLNAIEYETMTKWLKDKSEEEIKRAIDETAKSNIDNIKYVEKVLYGKKKNKKVVPEWFNSDIPSTENEMEDEEFKGFIEEFRNT